MSDIIDLRKFFRFQLQPVSVRRQKANDFWFVVGLTEKGNGPDELLASCRSLKNAITITRACELTASFDKRRIGKKLGKAVGKIIRGEKGGEGMNLTEKYFTLLGWTHTKPRELFPAQWNLPNGKYYSIFLPIIEKDYNHFQEWVVDEMKNRGFGFSLEPMNRNCVAPYFYSYNVRFIIWGTDLGISFSDKDFRIAGIKAAIKVLESASSHISDGKFIDNF